MAKKKEVLAPEEEEIQEVNNEGIFDPALDEALAASLNAEADAPVFAREVAEMVADDVEEVETIAEPRGRGVGRKPPAQDEAQPQSTPAAVVRRNSSEMRRSEEEWEAIRNQRQEDAVTVGRYLAAAKRNNVLTGKIAGVDTRGEHVFWIIYDGPVIVYIPFHEALPFLPEDLFENDKPRTRMNRQKQMMTKSIGATVPFSVEEVVPDGDVYLVFGSRRVAMQRISRRYFGRNAANPVKVGDDLTGHILAVGPHAAWINVNGVDVRLVPSQMSHRYMTDMQKVYSAGDDIKLRLQHLEIQDGKPVMALSGRPCEVDRGKRLHGRIRRGTRCVATLTSHRILRAVNPRTDQEESYYIANMWLEDVNLAAFTTLANAKEQEKIHSGDKVVVEVVQIAQSGYVRCNILKYLK